MLFQHIILKLKELKYLNALLFKHEVYLTKNGHILHSYDYIDPAVLVKAFQEEWPEYQQIHILKAVQTYLKNHAEDTQEDLKEITQI